MISPDAEAVFYGSLDFCAKPIFGIMLIIGHWNINPARMGLQIRDYTVPLGDKEKGAEHHENGNGLQGHTEGGTSSGVDTS